MNKHEIEESDDSELLNRGPSKSQKKRDMHALQGLGEALVALPKDRLAKIEIPESLRDAVKDAQRMPKRNEAFRRQMQFIGRLMRDVDPEPIQVALDEVNGVSRAQVARMHRLERLRDSLLEDEAVLTEIANEFPGTDVQRLRQMRRNAIKEKDQNKHPRSYREIFRMLREMDAASRGEDLPDERIEEGEEDE